MYEKEVFVFHNEFFQEKIDDSMGPVNINGHYIYPGLGNITGIQKMIYDKMIEEGYEKEKVISACKKMPKDTDSKNWKELAIHWEETRKDIKNQIEVERLNKEFNEKNNNSN